MYYHYNSGNRDAGAPLGGKNEIRVTGEGRVAALPDQANIILGISTEEIELTVAQQKNTEVSERVIQSMLALGIEQSRIKTTDYTIFPQYDFKDGIQVFRNYRVDHRLTVQTSNLEQVGVIVDTAVKNGANSINGVQFSLSNQTAYEQQALTIALQHATGKALTIAKTLQIQLLHPPVLVIEGNAASPPELYQPQATFVKSATTTNLEPGQVEVVMYITVVFRY